jgi:hypothetical protein
MNPHLYSSKETKNFEEGLVKFESIPVRGLIFLLKKLHIYELFVTYARDERIRQGTYSIASLLMVALEIILFRSPSKNDFYQNKKLGRKEGYKRLGTIAYIKGEQFPHSKTLDDAFLSLDPICLEPVLFALFKQLCSSKFFSHLALKKYPTYRLSIDAFYTHCYWTSSQHPCEACPFCLKRERHTKEGFKKEWYLHMEVVASLIFEGGFQLPLYVHRIRKKKDWEDLNENDLKQECEQTALPVILAKIRSYLPRLKLTVLLDGLHANQTSLEALKSFGFGWDIVLKRLTSVQEAIDPIDLQVRSLATKRFLLTQTACWTNDIPYGKHLLNAIEFNEQAQKKPSKRFAKINHKSVHYQWILSKLVQSSSLFSLVEEARSRWRGEDLINTLKNRGFYLKHDYSRHPSSQTIWKTLTFLAFALSSLYFLSDLGLKARKGVTFHFLMKQMLQDLFYLSYDCLFLCPYPKQLRFSLWMNAG